MNVLLIEDNPDHADIVMDCVQKAFSGGAHITWHTELVPGLGQLRGDAGDNPLQDVCLCDLQLPDSSIKDTTEQLSKLQTNVPIIVLTSLHDEEKAKLLIKGGAQDYLSKEDLNSGALYRTITYAIERRRQTALLEQRHRDQAAFCYSLSHDFKSPIRRIGTCLAFLLEDLSKHCELTEDELNHIDSIERNVALINNLTNDLYQYLNIDDSARNFSELDLNTALTEALQLLALDPNTLDLDSDTLPIVEGNRSQLTLVFRNLLDNSIKYCHAKPRIRIRAEISADDRFALISLTDNGIGMDPEKLDLIFTPFQRLDNAKNIQGSGLGLSIVKRIIDNHGGTITATSQPGQGTVFTVRLPYIQFKSHL